jgi:GTPase SAR1 family protein
VYDVGNKDSFRHINDWLNEVSRYAPENAIKLVVGHKCDLAEKIVSTESAKVIIIYVVMPMSSRLFYSVTLFYYLINSFLIYNT